MFKQFAVIAIGLVFCPLALAGMEILSQDDSMRREIREVFDAVRDGDLSRTQSLRRFGVQIVDETELFLDDENERIRREAVSLIASMGDPSVTSALVVALDDDNADVRELAANALLDYALQVGNFGVLDPGEAIVSASYKGELDGSAVLLLGYSRVGLGILEQASSGARLVKTSNAGPAVRVSLPARLALSRRGDNNALAFLEKYFASADDNSLLFALSNIGNIGSPSLLHALAAATLSNETPTGGGVPSGAEPSRRIVDEAVIAFVNRLSLRTDFDVGAINRFKPEQIETVKDLIDRAIPQE